MSLATAFEGSDRNYKRAVMHQAWGHLAPKHGQVYNGEIVFCFGEYGDITPITTKFKGLGDSPWFFGQMSDFIARKCKTRGRIYRFEGTYRLLKNGNGRFKGKVLVIKPR